MGFFHKSGDSVDRRLADTAKQGTGMSRVAHACATLLIILFSLGALVALSGDALTHILATGLNPASIPYAISAGVSTFLVVCMDVAMLYAASKLRHLRIRQADATERRGHYAILYVACALEASTYLYMAGKYDPPTNVFGWLLDGARALAAPAFGVYLSMAAPVPVGPRDILYQAELAAGAGMIRDVIQAANDPAAPLADKLALFGASAQMSDHDRERLNNMIGVLTQTSTQVRLEEAAMVVEGSIEPTGDDGGDPPAGNDTRKRRRERSANKALIQAGSGGKLLTMTRVRNETLSPEDMQAMGFALLDMSPEMTRAQLRDKLHCKNETARTIYTRWEISRRNTHEAAQ